MLYKKNTEKNLSDQLFKNPTCEYRATPFWAWNSVLEKEELLSQIECFKQMGFGGFHMHARAGLGTEYLGKDFMQLVKDCVLKAEKEEMLAWLYDEDCWPSGFAGGLVTKEPWTRRKHLLLTKEKLSDACDKSQALEKGLDYFFAAYSITQDENGYLVDYKRVGEDEEAPNKWYTYVCTQRPVPRFNGQTYVDILNKKAIDKFIDITYETYKKTVGDSFGKTVHAIFTDEPQTTRCKVLLDSFEGEALYAWTHDFDETFKATYNEDIADKLPEIFWELASKTPSFIRYAYFDHVAERFAKAFSDNCGKWCQENGIMLTGHVMDEPSLLSQTPSVGETIRQYRGFGLPGIDMLCNNYEYTTAKQAQSAVRQYGREGMVSEMYGVTGWTFDFRGHKLQGDWQAALGVTVRVPHLSWYSMAGAAKRDYPASIHYQSPWYKEYPLIEDHFARLNTALTRGKPIVNVGIIHPIESFWLHYGPNDLTQDSQFEINEYFKDISNSFLFNMIDFDYISESLLPAQLKNNGAPMQVGEMSYKTIVVPCCKTLRSTTLKALRDFKAAGGKLVFIGECPAYLDGKPSDAVKDLYDHSICIAYNHTQIRKTFADEIELTVTDLQSRKIVPEYVYQRRQDTNCQWLFIARGKPGKTNPEIGIPQNTEFKIKGEWYPVLYDTLTGQKEALAFKHRNNYTIIQRDIFYHDSLLLQLNPFSGQEPSANKKIELNTLEANKTIYFCNAVEYQMAEPNVLLLDMPCYAVDSGELQGPEEIMRVSTIARNTLRFPSSLMQPWVIPERPAKHTLHLQYKIQSDIEFDGAFLALERADKCRIYWNHQEIGNTPCGYFADKSIKKVALPTIQKGENVLQVDLPFAERTTAEPMYILGDFGVCVQGSSARIVEKASQIYFGALEQNRMPFYGGNVQYQSKFTLQKDSDVLIEANHYAGALLSVKIDGKQVGKIVFAPYQLTVSDLAAGEHTIEFTYFGNRQNTFGPLHRADVMDNWMGPSAWQFKGQKWSYEYTLATTGILSSPCIYVFEK